MGYGPNSMVPVLEEDLVLHRCGTCSHEVSAMQGHPHKAGEWGRHARPNVPLV